MDEKPDALAFGPFQLDLAGRRLTEAGRPVALGGRAFELLTALVERPGELVTKAELMARAWPDTRVEDANLQVQISAIRRALGQQFGATWIVAESGRGYRFTAPLEQLPAPRLQRDRLLPGELTSVVGREADVDAITDRLATSRILTIVGPGGIGKTTLALACARAAEECFADGVAFVEVTDGGDLAVAVAASLGLRFSEESAADTLTSFLAPLHLLLVLDSCEYAVEASAKLAEAILRRAPNTTIVCTSREPLRAEGEVVWRVDPLQTPRDNPSLCAEEALEFSAIRLFVERARAADQHFLFRDPDVGAVVHICRKLDGLPLAIELAAGRIPAFGLAELASALDHRFQALLQGRRTAAPRHWSLVAAIDWSYDSLSEIEQRALRSLSLFQGPFNTDSAAHLLAADHELTHEVLANLVAKSLVIADLHRTSTEYRLLDTMRDYARRKLVAAGELGATAARHAARVIAIVSRAGAELELRSMPDWLRYFSRQLQDVRAALDWSCAPDGDATLTVPLTLAAYPVWICLSRFEEASRGIEAALDVAEPESADEMALNIVLANVVLSVPEKVAEAAGRSQRAIDLAVRLQSPAAEFKATVALWDARIARGRVDLAYESAVRLSELVSGGPASPEGILAQQVIGTTEFWKGNLANARSALERVVSSSKGWHEYKRSYWYDFDLRLGTRGTLAVMLWLEGKPDSAIALALENAARALAAGNDNATPAVLADGACLMAVLAGDDSAAQSYLELIDASLRRGGPPGFASWTAIVRALLAARRGDAGPGLAFLATGFDVHSAHPRRVNLLAELAENLGYAGAGEPGRQLADTLLARIKRGGERLLLGEVQRVRAQLCTDEREARSLLEFAVKTARRQGAVSMELRAATNLAQRWPAAGRPLLEEVLQRYTEGHWTRDVMAAQEALANCPSA